MKLEGETNKVEGIGGKCEWGTLSFKRRRWSNAEYIEFDAQKKGKVGATRNNGSRTTPHIWQWNLSHISSPKNTNPISPPPFFIIPYTYDNVDKNIHIIWIFFIKEKQILNFKFIFFLYLRGFSWNTSPILFNGKRMKDKDNEKQTFLGH